MFISSWLHKVTAKCEMLHVSDSKVGAKKRIFGTFHDIKSSHRVAIIQFSKNKRKEIGQLIDLISR